MKYIQTFKGFVNEAMGGMLKTNVEVDQDFVEVGNILKKHRIQYFWSANTGDLLFNTEQEKNKAEKLLKAAGWLAESELFLGEGNYSLQNIDSATVEEFEKDWNRGSKVSGLMKLIKAATGKNISDIPEKAVGEFDKIVGGGIKASSAAIKILDVLNKYA